MTRRIAVTGAGGQLGRQVVDVFARNGDTVLGLKRPTFELTRERDLARLTRWRPDIVVNCAAWTDVDGCARDPARAMLVNGTGAGRIAQAAARAGAMIVQISTNEVFAGECERAYAEEDVPGPLNPYGLSKLEGERRVAAANTRHLVVRTAWLFGPGSSNFVTKILAAAGQARERGEAVRVVDDEWGNPTPTRWLATALSAAVGAFEAGHGASIVHLVGMPPVSRARWARYILREHHVDVVPVHLADYPRASTVPPHAVLRPSTIPGLSVPQGDWRTATDELLAAMP